jgi:hypothetical protein
MAIRTVIATGTGMDTTVITTGSIGTGNAMIAGKPVNTATTTKFAVV